MRNAMRMISLSTVTLSAAVIAACSGPIAVEPDAGQPPGSPTYGLITPQQAASIIVEHQDNPNFVLLDVRTDSEIATSHISGAEGLDFRSATFQDDLDQLDRDRIYLLYCRTGNRTGQTYAMMQDLGFEKVYDMAGGVTGWIGLGYPVCRGLLDAEHTCIGEFPVQGSKA